MGQQKLMINNFVLIYPKYSVKYNELDMQNINRKTAERLQRLKTQAIKEHNEIMQELNCQNIEPNESYIFVHFRREALRVMPEVYIEIDLNHLLEKLSIF